MIWLVIALILLPFGWVILYGAPYLPTLKRQTEQALDLLNLQPGQVLIELGAGDGRVALAAAKRGVKVIGFELNPVLCALARLRCWRYRQLVSIRCRSFWSVNLPKADGVFVFGIARIMSRLETKLDEELTKGARVVSYNFELPGKRANKHQANVYLYQY